MNMCTQWCQSKAWVIGFRGSAPQSRPDWWFRFRLLAVVWQTLLGTYWNRLNHVYLLKTTAPPAPSQKKGQQQHKFMNQIWNSGVTWCASQLNHLLCLERLPSVPERFTWTYLNADSLHAFLRSAAWNASPGILWVTASSVSPSFSNQRQDISHNRSAERMLTLSIREGKKRKGNSERSWKLKLEN